MIFVSNSKNELVTNILKWLDPLKKKEFVRINYDQPFDDFVIQMDGQGTNITFTQNGTEQSINMESDDIFYYHGYLPIEPSFSGRFFKEEAINLKTSLSKVIFLQKGSIGALPEEYNYKLYNLFLAKSYGLEVPDTIIGTKKYLEEYKSQSNDEFISKAITNVFKLKLKNGMLVGPGTVKVTEKSFERQSIATSLMQKKASKAFDIRTVLFDREMYSLAIFTNNKIDSVDYRSLYTSHVPRNVPFNLPESIKDKLLKLAKKLELKFCSFDLIYTTDGKYVFIEVNPEGVVDWVSAYGNFGIEKIIANKITTNEC